MSNVANTPRRAQFLTMAALAAAYSAACLSWSTQPFQFTTLSVQTGLGDVAAGWVLSSEIGLAAVVSMLLGYLGRARATRTLLLSATALTVLSDFITLWIKDLPAMFVVRATAGICEGILIAAVNEAVARTDNPEKRYGQINAWMNVAGFSIVLLMPLALTRLQMPRAVFAVLTGATLLCAALVALYPRNPSYRSETGTAGGLGGWKGWLICAAVLLSSTAVGSFYPVTESVGQSAGLSETALGFSLSLAFIGAFIGSYWAAFLDTRLGPFGGAILVAVGFSAAVYLLIHAQNSTAFGAGMLLFGIFWFHGLMTCLGFASAVDPSGGCAATAGGAFFLGGGVGPLLGGYELHWGSGNPAALVYPIVAMMALFAALVGCVSFAEARHPSALART